MDRERARAWEAAKERGAFDKIAAETLERYAIKKGLQASRRDFVAVVRRRINAEILLPGLS